MKDSKFTFKSFLFASLLLFSLNSCTSEEEFDKGTNEQQVMSLTINANIGGVNATQSTRTTQNGTDDENQIEKLRAIVFKVENGVLTEQLANEFFYRENLQDITIKFRKSPLIRVLLIANERDNWNLNNNNQSAEEIKNAIVTYKAEDLKESKPFVMFAESSNLAGQNDLQQTLSLKRNLARVDLSLNCTFKNIEGMGDAQLKLLTARIYRMASISGLGNKFSSLDLGKDFIDGTTVDFIEGENYQTIKTDDQPSGFYLGKTGEGKDHITFYVPEYQVTDINAYTYIYITGEYITKETNPKTIKVAYTIPVGAYDGYKNINDETVLTKEELQIDRNNLYRMKGAIKSVKQINDIHVDVLPWNKENVSGSINKPEPSKLNVSDLTVKLGTSNEIISIQFWTDLLSENDLRVLPNLTLKKAGTEAKVNDIFVNLADEEGTTSRPGNLLFENTSEVKGIWGHLKLQFQPGVTLDETYIITLAAGSLRRTIEVTAITNN